MCKERCLVGTAFLPSSTVFLFTSECPNISCLSSTRILLWLLSVCLWVGLYKNYEAITSFPVSNESWWQHRRWHLCNTHITICTFQHPLHKGIIDHKPEFKPPKIIPAITAAVDMPNRIKNDCHHQHSPCFKFHPHTVLLKREKTLSSSTLPLRLKFHPHTACPLLPLLGGKTTTKKVCVSHSQYHTDPS